MLKQRKKDEKDGMWKSFLEKSKNKFAESEIINCFFYLYASFANNYLILDMTSKLRYLFLLILIGVSGSTFAQGIYGKVIDLKKKEPVIGAVIRAIQGGIIKGGAVTDEDGKYEIKPLESGYYDLLLTHGSYDSTMETKISVAPDQDVPVDFKLEVKVNELKVFHVKAHIVPLIGNSGKKIEGAQIAQMPTTQVNDVVASATSVYQSQRGGAVNIGGARAFGTLYIIDGVQVQGNVGIDMSQGSVEMIEVLSDGVPAKYGDFSGGVVNITSRGVAKKFVGDLKLQHSIDGYNNNLVSFSVAGPLLKMADKGDSTHTKKPVMGYALSGDYYYDNNRYPTYYDQYVVKPDVLSKLQKNPLHPIFDNSGNGVFNNSSDYVTMNDLSQSKIPPHNKTKEGRLNGKVDWQPVEGLHIVGGINFDYVRGDYYGQNRMFNPEATPYQDDITTRAYLRLTQKFGKSMDTSHGSIISNAFYTIQADYQRENIVRQDPVFKNDFFKYAYVGKFDISRKDLYFQGKDSLTGSTAVLYTGSQPTVIKYTPSNINPLLSNYTTQLFNDLAISGTNMQFLRTIQSLNGLVNGDEPQYTYGLFYSPGTTQTYSLDYNSNQYALNVDASFDLKIGKLKHAIEFGLYYQQRVIKEYIITPNLNGTGTSSIWNLMRQSASTIDNGNLALDKMHPIFKSGGQTYTYQDYLNKKFLLSSTDTVVYNYVNNGNSTFDKNIRKKLGLSSTQDINIDNLDPSTFSLNMFSADELLNSGHSFVNYYGYNYDGTQQTGTVNFNDFWTAKDANGNYTRPIAAFTPNYIGGYILDKFRFEDLSFNIGVRIERYSANNKVLIDPYSEYPEKSLSQVSGAQNTINGGTHPGNMGSNYVVYVDDNNSATPSIIGYRNGNNWYDPKGKFIEDPGVLRQYSNGRDPQPYLQNPNSKITDTSFNPNLSFTDYTPQVTVMPRIQFKFPLSETANFFAHYDIYSQRPPTGGGLGIATAYTYYYLAQNNTTIIPNANLKPQQTYDYEAGFEQELTKNSALKITGFYKERKNMVAVVPYLFAWPSTYYTYGNRDFSTTKGGTVNYDMRATNHLRLGLSYTLQFAEGTGSSEQSSNSGNGSQISPNGLLQSFISAGIPNMRYVSALTYDSRHNFSVNADYRFNEGEGPEVNGHHILQNAGVDIVAKARSGEPYTRLADALGNTVIGGINGSRLPWHYGVDLRIDKNFAVSFNKKHIAATDGVEATAGTKSKKRGIFNKQYYLRAYIYVNNLLNTQDILSVYGYTGKPLDNGYLSSSFGQQYVPQQINPASYKDLYTVSYANPNNLNWARTINFGIEFNF